MAWQLPGTSLLPGSPGPSPNVDVYGMIADGFGSLAQGIKGRMDENASTKAFGSFADTLYRDQPAAPMAGPQGLAASLFGGGATQGYNPGDVVRGQPLAAPMDAASARVAQAHGDQPNIFNDFISTVRDGGLTNPNGLAAVAATGRAESGYKPANSFGQWSDPSQSGQPGTAGGIMSWRAERLDNLRQFAAQVGDDPNRPSPKTQGMFLLQEDPALIQKLQSAQSPEEAQQLMNNAWRYAGYDQAGGETARRIATARNYAAQFGATPSQPAPQGVPAGGPAQPVAQQVAQMAPAQDLAPLPPREVLVDLFKNKETRPIAAALVQSRLEAQRDGSDPMKKLAYEKARLEVEALSNPRPQLINGGDGQLYDPASKTWITAPNGGDDFSKRQKAAAGLGLQPDDPAYRSYVLTGKMPREDQAPLTATDKKAILEADEMVQTNDMALQMLGSVLSGEEGQTLNDRAGSGAGAGFQAWMARNDPTGLFDDAKGQATTELENVVIGQALASLKATFGSAPTEGERKILVDLQASIDKTPAERKAIINRAMEAAKRRLDFNQRRADELRGGTFYKQGGGKPAQEPGGVVDFSDYFRSN